MTDKPTHTPGPWYVAYDYRIEHGPLVAGEGFLIAKAEINPFGGSGKANARLIAAAPDLLTACRQLLKHCITVGGFPEKGKGRTVDQQSAFDAARAAIAKAKVTR